MAKGFGGQLGVTTIYIFQLRHSSRRLYLNIAGVFSLDDYSDNDRLGAFYTKSIGGPSWSTMVHHIGESKSSQPMRPPLIKWKSLY